MNNDTPKTSAAVAAIRFFAQSKITPLLIVAALLAGFFSLQQLPREEEPQIRVPIFDVFVSYPGASAEEVQKQIVDLGERKFWEIPGVEYVYSTSATHQAFFVVRFKVGEDVEKSLIKLYTKVHSNLDFLPPGASQPLIKQRSIDDVPILALTFYSTALNPQELRHAVSTLRQKISSIPNVSETHLIGGRRRQFQIFFDETKLKQYTLAPNEITKLIQQANIRIQVGHQETNPLLTDIEADSHFKNADDIARLAVGVSGGRVITLQDVAQIVDGSDEDDLFASIMFAQHAAPREVATDKKNGAEMEAVTLTISKRAGTNATELSEKILSLTRTEHGKSLPPSVRFEITRDYGHTAAEKSNELLFHMALAILGVSVLVAWALGFRAAAVVATAIPTTLALTLLTFHLFGFTINRITLFALIFTIGILVDDPIVGVENIVRHMHLAANRGRDILTVSAEAISEIISPLLLATLAVIAAILPMAFVGGLMGPYMRPIPIGASAAMIFSLIVSLVVTPWAAVHLLNRNSGGQHTENGDNASGTDWLSRLYRAYMNPLIHKPRVRAIFLSVLGVLLVASVILVPLKAVKMKMLPFDNKNEFQVILDMPEGTPLETTRRIISEMANIVLDVPETTTAQLHIGTSAPYNFNGLVRHYFLRRHPHQADLQVNLLPKNKRARSSHEIAEGLRPRLNDIAHKAGGHVQVAEIPPGPPVISTLLLEIYGPDPKARLDLAKQVEQIFAESEGITDVAVFHESPHPLNRLRMDTRKASLNGIAPAQIADALTLATSGKMVDWAHLPQEPEPVEIILRLPKEKRADSSPALGLHLLSRFGRPLPLSDFVAPELSQPDQPIHHKNLMPVAYVAADITDSLASPTYAIMELQKKLSTLKAPDGKPLEILFTAPPSSPNAWALKWDGEWHITYEVFRDLGIVFAAVLILIFMLVVGWFQSFKTPWVVMLPIPLALVGILPAHAMTGMFFTATSMIGMIAGAGIVVRNAIILVDFIELQIKEGKPLEEAVIHAGEVRFRPMLLTAAAVVVGASVILFDPIFQGLALALISGEIASTLLSRTAVPVLYYALSKKNTIASPTM